MFGSFLTTASRLFEVDGPFTRKRRSMEIPLYVDVANQETFEDRAVQLFLH